MKLRVALGVVSLFSVVMAAACSSDEKSAGTVTGTGGGSTADGSTDESGGAAAEAGSKPPMAYNMDCSTARWANVSAECWSCMCAACADTLNKCNEDCGQIFKCAQDNKTLVNKIADISCEVRATGNVCLQTPEAQAATTALLNFDGCLIGSDKKETGEFRVCDTVCKTPYPGDVCERFPLPSNM